MIKKPRLSFILSLIISMLLLFASLFMVCCIITQTATTEMIAKELKQVSETADDSGRLVRRDALILISDGEEVLVINGAGYYAEQTIVSLKDKCLEKTSGSEGSVYYFFKASDNGAGGKLYALNFENHLARTAELRVSILILLSVFYALSVGIILLCSIKIFKPLHELQFRQKQFISDAGHELKTPVAIISANADVLSNTVDSKYLKSIKTQTERLNFLINDMIMLAKLDEHKFEVRKSEFSLSNAVTECVLPFEELAFEKGKMIATDIADNIEYFGDRESVIKIVNILVDNAIKYSSNGGNIKVSLTEIKDKKIITVYNTGSEIPSELSNKIFERFFRGDASRASDNEGSGLGLAIASSLCAINGWEIKAVSEKGVSMTITVTM